MFGAGSLLCSRLMVSYLSSSARWFVRIIRIVNRGLFFVSVLCIEGLGLRSSRTGCEV